MNSRAMDGCRETGAGECDHLGIAKASQARYQNYGGEL
jgi:hypothetical protein